MRTFSFRLLLLLIVVGSTVASAQSPSPFTPAAPPAQAAANQDAEYELTGVIGGKPAPLVNITRLRDKRTYWLKPGESVAGLVLESFNPETNQAVVSAEGRSRTLSLKSPAKLPQGTAGVAMAPPPLAMATVAPRVPVTDDEKATEARMLVSDLLEIGMVQRKAYEDAQKQAAAQPASDLPPPPPRPSAQP